MRIAVLADIHGNLPALEAVQEDMRSQSPDLVLLAGDQINRLPWSNGVLEMVGAEGWPAIAGNHEELILHLSKDGYNSVFNDRKRFADSWWTVSQLEDRYWPVLEALPSERTLTLGDAMPIRLLHGIEGDSWQGITDEMSDDVILRKFSGIHESVIVTAHTHAPLNRQVGERHIFNPGSVGMPYNGDPRAQYMLLEWKESTWRPHFRCVEYDRGLVHEAFDRLGLFQVYGPLGTLYWQTIATGTPWVSDFQAWIRTQPSIVREDFENAVALYLSLHGPGNWAFQAV
jgi:predicted phosphodiesterase